MYVPAPVVSHTGPLIVIGELAHGTPQLTGDVTLTLLTQLPLVAVTVKFVPIGMLMTVLPLIVPALAVTTPVSVVYDTDQKPVPAHKGCPTVSRGYRQPPVPGHEAGDTTVRLWLQLGPLVAVTTTLVPRGTPVIFAAPTVPALELMPDRATLL